MGAELMSPSSIALLIMFDMAWLSRWRTSTRVEEDVSNVYDAVRAVICRLKRADPQVLAVDSLPSVVSTSMGGDLLCLPAEAALSIAALLAASPSIIPAPCSCSGWDILLAVPDEPMVRVGAVKEPVSVSSAPIASSVVSALLSSDASRDLLESPAACSQLHFPAEVEVEAGNENQVQLWRKAGTA